MHHFPSPADWRDQILYQVFTDRFENGDPSLDTAHPTAQIDRVHPKGLRGGDLCGIERRLDYIKSLGATAIWISPVSLNDAGGAYHGYAAIDFSQVSPHLGGMPALRSLIRAAHDRGIYILLDVVCNHMGRRITSSHGDYPRYRPPPHGYRMRWINPKRKYPPPFGTLRCFHNHGHIRRFVGDELVYGAVHGLDDLRTELPYVREHLIRIHRKLIADTDCDGFRIDTVRHVELDFWQQFGSAMRDEARSLGKNRFLLIGEVWDANDAAVARYVGRGGSHGGLRGGSCGGQPAPFALDSATDYPLHAALMDVLLHRKPPVLLAQRHDRLRNDLYDPTVNDQLLTFLDNHDVPRFLWRGHRDMSRGERLSYLRIGLTFLLTSQGIPCIYAGTEQGFFGGPDPANREEMTGRFNPHHRLYRLTARLAALRTQHVALRRGVQTYLQAAADGPGVIAFTRTFPGDSVLVILNTAPIRRPMRTIRTPFAPRTLLVDVLGIARPTRVDAQCRLAGRMIPPHACRVYCPA
ncbi:MAG: hypothetical protein KAS72_05425 [Phycisphaerales bacterium]|nr:hypothetical protein [Phycisphaerales bacterium]